MCPHPLPGYGTPRAAAGTDAASRLDRPVRQRGCHGDTLRHITTHIVPATGLRGIADTSWHPHGACHGMTPEDADATFFPLPRDHDAIEEAKELCSMCPVRHDCLNYALENRLKDGIWGGLTEAERRPWHDGLPQRLDYRRVIAFFNGRDVHLTEAERQIIVDHAYVRGWRPYRLAAALKISNKHARDLLKDAANKVFDRDLKLGVPPRPKQKKPQERKTAQTPNTSHPRAGAPVKGQPVQSTSARAPHGKAA